jgi:16S rRNA (uracil1498-N3)-methyltransferase
MQRVFLPRDSFAAERLVLPPDVAHYLTRVLRLRPGQEFVALDGGGGEYRVRLVAGPPLHGEVIEQLPQRPAAKVALTLYQGLPRGKRFPLIIQKASELGVARIVPVLTARAQVKVATGETASKVDHWRAIVREAAEQCLRPSPPELMMPLGWGEALALWQGSGEAGLLLDETCAGSPDHGLGEALRRLGRPTSLAVFVGPEGGFDPGEADAAREAGLQPVSLGARVLRTETAAVVVCALVMYEYGELG